MDKCVYKQHCTFPVKEGAPKAKMDMKSRKLGCILATATADAAGRLNIADLISNIFM